MFFGAGAAILRAIFQSFRGKEDISTIALSFWVFLLSGFAALLIALVTISVQTVKAAMSNPADVLQYE